MPETDSRLLQGARQGDEGLFLALYRRHRTPLFRFVWRLTGSVPAAEDITQECFLALLKGASFDAERGSLQQYLFGIARNLAMRTVRAIQRESGEAEETEPAPGPFEDALSAERSEIVARAVAELPLLQREALILFVYEELRLDEIAQISGAEVGAVKARLHRARETLRCRLAPLLGSCANRR